MVVLYSTCVPTSYSPIIASRLRIMQVHAVIMNAKVVVFRLSRTSFSPSISYSQQWIRAMYRKKGPCSPAWCERFCVKYSRIFIAEWEAVLLVTYSRRRRLESCRFHQGVSEWWDNQSHIWCYRLGLARASELTEQNGYSQAVFGDEGQILRSIKQCLVTSYCTPPW